MRVEILTDSGMFRRGSLILHAMIAAAPRQVEVRNRWSGQPCLLMVYGTGHPVRRPQQLANLAAGGHMIGWDLGYPWGGKEAMRATIDADHPTKFIRPEPPDRWDATGIQLREDANPRGHVVVVGMGPKSHRAFGYVGLEWERRALAVARRAYPGREIVYRPKRPTDPQPSGEWLRRTGPIEAVLRGASLVICRHSNVAIDACIAGIPVACQHGAAAALYSANVKRPTIPTRDERLQFLRSLAWWQWTPKEAAQAWTYLESRLCA